MEAIANSDVSAEEARLEAVGYRLATANFSRCSTSQMFTGLVVHDIAAYSRVDRKTAQETYGLTAGFGVLHVVPGSAAEKSGVVVGDEILFLNGNDLSSFESKLVSKRATYERTERFIDLLDRELAEGSANIVIRRAGTTRSLTLTGRPGCGGRTTYRSRSTAEAWSDGHYVAVTDPMIRFAEDDQELAFVVAHEMAHNILHHSERLPKASEVLAQFGIGWGRMKRLEIAADTLSIELMENAGYDATASERFLVRTPRLIPLDLGLTHPRVARRVQIVRDAIKRLRTERSLAGL